MDVTIIVVMMMMMTMKMMCAGDGAAYPVPEGSHGRDDDNRGDDDEDEDDDDDDDDDQGGHTSCWPGYIPRHDLQDGFRKIFLEQLRVWFANVESGIRSGLTFQLKRRCLIHLRRNAPGTSPFDMDFNLKTKVS